MWHLRFNIWTHQFFEKAQISDKYNQITEVTYDVNDDTLSSMTKPLRFDWRVINWYILRYNPGGTAAPLAAILAK